MAIKNKILVVSILASLLFTHSYAFAGFKIRRLSEPKSAAAPEVGSSKVENVEKEIIDAILSKKPETTIERNDKVFIKKQSEIEEEKKEQESIVTGFGQDLPLVISLQQIVPSKYQFTVSPGVDANMLTSWEGGRKWDLILGDMLKSHEMSFDIKDNVVVVKRLNTDKPVIATKQPEVKAEAIRESSSSIPTKEQNRRPAMQKTSVAQAPKSITPKPVEKPIPSTDIIDTERQPKVKETNFDDEPISLQYPPATPPMNIISSKNAPIKVDDYMEPFFDSNEMVNPNDPLARAKWIGHQSQTLREVLTEWSEKEGVEIYWTIDYDYKLNRNIAFFDKYEVAVARLIDIFRNVRPQPYGQLHHGDRGPLVLVVNSYDLSY